MPVNTYHAISSVAPRLVHKSVHNTLCRLTGPRELVRGSTNSGQAIFGVPPGTNPLSLVLGDATTDSAGYPAILQALVGAAGNNPALIALAYLVGGVAIVYDLTTEVLQFLVTFPLLAAPCWPSRRVVTLRVYGHVYDDALASAGDALLGRSRANGDG
jgi:hypothetical protein